MPHLRVARKPQTKTSQLWRHGNWHSERRQTYTESFPIMTRITITVKLYAGSKLCGTQALRSVKKPNLTVAPMYSHRVQIHLTLMNLSFVQAPNVVLSPAKDLPRFHQPLWAPEVMIDIELGSEQIDHYLIIFQTAGKYALMFVLYFCFTGLNPQNTWNIPPTQTAKTGSFHGSCWGHLSPGCPVAVLCVSSWVECARPQPLLSNSPNPGRPDGQRIEFIENCMHMWRICL